MVQQVSREIPGKEQQLLVCRHHWIIEAPMGPVSRGTCRVCDEVREFKNFIDSAPWSEDTSGTSSDDKHSPVDSSDDRDDLDEA